MLRSFVTTIGGDDRRITWVTQRGLDVMGCIHGHKLVTGKSPAFTYSTPLEEPRLL